MIFAREPASDNGSASLRYHGDKTASFASCPPERKNGAVGWKAVV